MDGAMMQNEVFADVIRVLRAHTQAPVEIGPQTRIGADLEIDSVEIFDIVMELEDLYDVSLPVEAASDIETVGDLVARIGQLRNA